MMTNGTHILDCVGLDISKDRILEIACIITDGKLTKQIEVAVEITYNIALFLLPDMLKGIFQNTHEYA
jgi:oligoribonuclease (3'-5' exoribonuclease)